MKAAVCILAEGADDIDSHISHDADFFGIKDVVQFPAIRGSDGMDAALIKPDFPFQPEFLAECVVWAIFSQQVPQYAFLGRNRAQRMDFCRDKLPLGDQGIKGFRDDLGVSAGCT